MTPERWRVITRIFQAALQREIKDRPEFLDDACQGDAAMRMEVAAMLAAHESPSGSGGAMVDETSVGPPPGTRLGTYRLSDVIDAGGMGIVYRAHDERLQRDVAIKVLRDPDDDETARRRLLREARAAAGLNHPSICTVYEVGEAEGRAFIAMEFVDGRPLNGLIADRALSETDVVRLGRELAGGLAYAHALGIVHGDLKPANVMVVAGGGVKLLDFGLARRLTGENATMTPASFAMAGMIAGTPAYMAPERFRGNAADARADVWALGMILQEMTACLRDVPAQLRQVIARCLEADPERRYATGGEVAEALEAVQPLFGAWPRPQVIAGAVILIAIAVLMFRFRDSVWPSRIESIAVLPFANTSGDASLEYVSATVGDQVGADLGSISAIRVLAGQATQGYKGSTKSAAKIADELGAASLLQGSTLVAGDRVRIVVRLIQASSQRQVWAHTYEDDLKDLPAASRMIARAIVDEIKPALTPEQRQRIERRPPPVDPAVLDLVHAGRPFDSTSIADFHKRREYIDRAIALAPDYAPAYATLAQWYNVGLSQNLVGAPALVYAATKQAVNTALRLDPENAEAYAAGAGIVLHADWDWDRAAALIERGLAVNPNSANIHGRRRFILTVTRRFDEAFIELRRFRSLYPTNPNYWDPACWTYLSAHQYATVRRELESADANFKPHAFGLRWRAVGDAIDGRVDDARQTCDALMPRTDNDPRTAAMCGFVFGRIGDSARATNILSGLMKRAAGAYVDPVLIAAVQAGLGRRNEMFATLERAADEHAQLVIEVDCAPWFDPYRDDPRYQAFVRRVGFPQYKRP